MKSIKKCLVSAVIFFLSFRCFSFDPKSLPIDTLFKEMIVYEYTGFSTYKGIEEYSPVARPILPLLNLVYRNKNFEVRHVFDLLVPENSGFVNSFSLYEPFSDDSKWLSSLLENQEEIFFVASPEILEEVSQELENEAELLDPEDSSEIEEISEIVKKESQEEPEEKNPIERRLLTSEKALRLFSVDGEILSVKNTGDERIAVKVFGNNMLRRFYDNQYRVINTEYWQMSDNLKASKIIRTEKYEYGTGHIPLSCKVVSENQMQLMSYDEKGRVQVLRNYEKVSEEKSSYVLTARTNWTYNAKGKLSEKSSVNYSYQDKTNGKITGKHTKKDVYQYKVDENTPDYYYYEDDELHLLTVYSAKNSYVTTMYFDGGFVVEAYYENGRRTKDLYYMNGVLKRKKTYVDN